MSRRTHFDNALATPVITRGSSIVRTVEALEPGQGWAIRMGQKAVVADSNAVANGIKYGTAGNAVFRSWCRLTPGGNCFAVALTATHPGYFVILNGDEGESVADQLSDVDQAFSDSIPSNPDILAVPYIGPESGTLTFYTQHMKSPWVGYATEQHGNAAGVMYITELLSRGININ